MKQTFIYKQPIMNHDKILSEYQAWLNTYPSLEEIKEVTDLIYKDIHRSLQAILDYLNKINENN